MIASIICTLALLAASGVATVSWWQVQQERAAELRILETEFHVLLRLAEHARERATKNGATSTTNFADAKEALRDARTLIESEPALSKFKPSLERECNFLE